MKRDQHIFLVFHNFDLGGVQRRMVDIANYVTQQQKYRHVTCHILLREKSEFSFDRYLKPGLQFQLHYAPRPPRILWIGRFLWRLKNVYYFVFLAQKIWQYRPAAVLAFLQFSLPALVMMKGAFFWQKFRLVVSQDNILSLYNRPEHVTRVFPHWLIRFLYRFCDTIIVQTEFAKRDLIKSFRIPAHQIAVIQNWVVDTTLPAVKKRYDIIYCGRFVPQKRLDRLLQVVAKVRRQGKKSLAVLLVGHGSDETRLRSLINRLQLDANVQILPSTHQVKRLIAQSKIFMLTSDFEGHPMVLLEAMALQVVPVVKKYPGVNEYINDGVDGYIESSLDQLAARVMRLLKNESLRKKVALAARRSVLRHNNSNLIDHTLQVLINHRN